MTEEQFNDAMMASHFQSQSMAAEAERQLFGINAGDGEKLVKVIERQSFVLMELMQAYERRVRSDCKTQEELDKRPWECAEYRAAADLLRTLHSPASSENSGG